MILKEDLADAAIGEAAKGGRISKSTNLELKRLASAALGKTLTGRRWRGIHLILRGATRLVVANSPFERERPATRTGRFAFLGLGFFDSSANVIVDWTH
jgi:hypothetical protein